MNNWIFCILFCTSLPRYVKACNVEPDYERCGYTVTCNRHMDYSPYWDQFTYNHEISLGYMDNNDEALSCPRPVVYQDIELYSVYLVIEKYDNIDYTAPVLTEYDSEQDSILDIVYGLDLSNIGYKRTPIINSMASLAKLNVSYNHITTAVLSNVNELKKITELDLSHNSISVIDINYDHYPYKYLKEINLSHNHITNLPDSIFKIFIDLQKLDLSNNNIDTLTRTTFDNIKNIVELDLSNNKLTTISSSLFRFNELKSLNLSENKLHALNLTDFETLNQLEILDLSKNSIITINVNILNDFFYFPSLKSIDFSKNCLKSLPKGLFKKTTIFNFSIEENILEGLLERDMFQGINVTRLDFSGQFFTEIHDYAFYDHNRLHTLLLQSNRIKFLSNKCFKNVLNLRQLDLSGNQINNLDFDKTDLRNLEYLLLKDNQLTEIKRKQLQHLSSLQYLDLSENYITRLESNSLQSLKNLIKFDITHNQIQGLLDTDTFAGLVSLPSLDLSHQMLTVIQNSTFSNMIRLRDLGMSHCKISELQYNTFIHTGHIDKLDLSYNSLKDFSVNITQLGKLSTLLLNNNLIKTITLSTLNKFAIPHNVIQNMYNESFSDLINLSYLDVSYNENLNFTEPIFNKDKALITMNLSGVKTPKNFAFFMNRCSISNLKISNSSLEYIKELNLYTLANLNSLDLSYNSVTVLQAGDFTNVNTLKVLDLSFNQITFIQQGVFKDNNNLHLFNISHNLISTIGYGIFRGLNRLSILDMSYNNIKDLQIERFYDIEHLSKLIVDHNKIDSLDNTFLAESSLSKLSIGDKPLPCEILVRHVKQRTHLEIAAIRLVEHGEENVNGITCNNEYAQKQSLGDKPNGNEDKLNRLQNELNNFTNKRSNSYNNDNPYLEKVTSILSKLTVLVDINNNTNMMLNNTNTKLNESNIILNKILNRIINNNDQVTTAAFYTSSGKRTGNLLSLKTYIPFIGHESNVSQPIDYGKSETESGHLVLNNNSTKSLFTEICVGVILLIIILLVLYKVYRSGILIRNRVMFRTRNLSGSIGNSSL